MTCSTCAAAADDKTRNQVLIFPNAGRSKPFHAVTTLSAASATASFAGLAAGEASRSQAALQLNRQAGRMTLVVQIVTRKNGNKTIRV